MAAGVVAAAEVAEADFVVADLPLPPQPSAITATAERIDESSRPERRGVIDEVISGPSSCRAPCAASFGPTLRRITSRINRARGCMNEQPAVASASATRSSGSRSQTRRAGRSSETAGNRSKAQAGEPRPEHRDTRPQHHACGANRRLLLVRCMSKRSHWPEVILAARVDQRPLDWDGSGR